jgi:hypothetical protein
MTIVEPADFEEYEFLERRFWETLRQTFTRVLNLSIEPVDEYRASLLHSPVYERVLALHDDPLDVAAILESVRKDHAGLHSFLSMRRIEARRKKASPLRLRFSQSLASRRQRLSQAMVRSTIHRLGRTANPCT